MSRFAKHYPRLRILEDNLLWFTIGVTGAGLVFPALGIFLEAQVALLLGVLIFLVSLTFDAQAVRRVVIPQGRPPYLLIGATALVYIPMSLIGWGIGHLFFESETLRLGQTLVGTLPTDVSAPLLVLLAQGNVALAAVMNAVNTALAPFVVPALFALFTGEALDFPVLSLMFELAIVVLFPLGAGVWLRTRFPQSVAAHEPLYSFGASLLYLLLLLAVVGVNAGQILSYGVFALHIAGAQLLLNLAGYLIAWVVSQRGVHRPDRIALLFTVSKKEFSIAAVLVFRADLPPEVAVPAAFYAVLQMVTSPLAVSILKRATQARRAHGD
jgi:bile acid:Na+ symporter, BASS family